MRQKQPTTPDNSTTDDLLNSLNDDRPTPRSGRAWVSTNMVMSLDGAFASNGRSGGLSSEADHDLFLAQRSLVDVILVGASTVRAEGSSRPPVSAAAANSRRSAFRIPAYSNGSSTLCRQSTRGRRLKV